MTDWVWRNGEEMIRAGVSVQPGEMEGRKRYGIPSSSLKLSLMVWEVTLAGWGEGGGEESNVGDVNF